MKTILRFKTFRGRFHAHAVRCEKKEQEGKKATEVNREREKKKTCVLLMFIP